MAEPPRTQFRSPLSARDRTQSLPIEALSATQQQAESEARVSFANTPPTIAADRVTPMYAAKFSHVTFQSEN